MKKIVREVKVERYFPDVLAPAKEMKAIAKAEDPEFQMLYEKAWKWFANTFISYTDLEGIERWEDMLDIIPPVNASLDDRRAAIFLAINGMTPYTEKSFANLLTKLYGEGMTSVQVYPNDYVLQINIDSNLVFKSTAIRRYARVIAPANLIIRISYNQTNISNKPMFVGVYCKVGIPSLVEANTDPGEVETNTNQYHQVYAKVGINYSV
jgi:hypothetical protein